MAAPPASTKTSLQQRLSARARERWPQLAGIDVRFRGAFAYVTARLPDGDTMPLMRLRYGGSAARWGFAIYLASKNGQHLLTATVSWKAQGTDHSGARGMCRATSRATYGAWSGRERS
jgi:hypothetical protein